jgi:hypothetical protein
MVSEAERNLILHEGSTIGKVNAEPRKHRKTRNVPSSSANKVNAMSLAQRAEALAKRKVQSYRVIVRVDEETYSGLVDLGERANMKVEDAAFRAMREGLRKYADLAPRALEDEGLSDIPLGERLSRPHDEDLSAFRSSQATGEDLEQKKAFVKAIGLQTHG